MGDDMTPEKALAAAAHTNVNPPFTTEDVIKFQAQLDAMPSAEEPDYGDGTGGVLVGGRA